MSCIWSYYPLTQICILIFKPLNTVKPGLVKVWTFIQVSTLARLSPDPHCHTQCGDGGCHCVAKLLPLSQMDHLLLVTDSGQAVSCLCGDFQVSKFQCWNTKTISLICTEWYRQIYRSIFSTNFASLHYQKPVISQSV